MSENQAGSAGRSKGQRRDSRSGMLHPSEPFRDAYTRLTEGLEAAVSQMYMRTEEAGRDFDLESARARRDYSSARDAAVRKMRERRGDEEDDGGKAAEEFRSQIDQLDKSRAKAEQASEERLTTYRESVESARKEAEEAVRTVYAEYLDALKSGFVAEGAGFVDVATLAAIGESMVAAARGTSTALAATRRR